PRHRPLAACHGAAAPLAARPYPAGHPGDRGGAAPKGGGGEGGGGRGGVARLRKRREVRSVFVDGGRVPPGTLEVRRAALIVNYTPKTERKITQRELELSISNELTNVPDIRYWFLDENGLRAISLVVTGIDSNIVSNVASELATQMKRIPE